MSIEAAGLVVVVSAITTSVLLIVLEAIRDRRSEVYAMRRERPEEVHVSDLSGEVGQSVSGLQEPSETQGEREGAASDCRF